MGKEANAAKRAAAVAKAAAAKAELAAAQQEAVEAGEPGEENAGTAAALLPMFADVVDEEVLRIDVVRNEPIDEGLVGHVPPQADEDAIVRRFGGGVFELRARATSGRILKRRTITLGGEPRFESEDAARRYAIKMGKLPDSKAAPAVVTPQGPSFSELMSWMQASHTQTVEMMKLQVQASEAAAEERRRRDREDQRDREDRLRRDNEEARQRDRDHQQAMLAMLKRDEKSADPMTFITMLMKGLELGRDLGGGGGGAGDGNPVTAFLANLPVLMQKGVEMLRAGADASRAHHGGQLVPVAAAPPQQDGRKVALTGSTAEKMRKLMRAVQARGANPVEVLEHTLDQLVAQVEAVPLAVNGQTAAGATAAGGGAAPVDVPAPPSPRPSRRADPGNGTDAAARATAGR